MKPYLFITSLFALLCFHSTTYGQQFFTQGDAVQIDPITYRITPSQNSKAGMITNLYPVNLAQNFTINFQLNFGVNDDGGADGMMFVLSNLCSPVLSTGGGLGVSNFTNALLVEFDTYNNVGAQFFDINNDHTGIYSNGTMLAPSLISDAATTPVCLNSTCGNVEDGAWHNVTIRWEYISATSQRISLIFDGSTRTTSTRNHIAERFNNATNVFWSITASTGAASNLQQFRVVDNNNNNSTICRGAPVTLTAPTLGTNYSWTGGSTSTTNTASFTLTNSGSIACSYRDFCGIDRTVNFNITVNPLPVVTIQNVNACELNPPPLTATPAAPGTYTYVWTVPSGVPNPGNTASFTTIVTGTYSVVITNTATVCSSAAATGSVITAPAIKPLFNPIVDTICRGAVIPPLPTVSTNGINGTWSPALNNQQTTTYTFTPSGAVCAYTETKTIVVNQTPTVDFSAYSGICKGETVILDPSSAGFNLTYLWQNGSTTSTFAATQPGTYSVLVTNACGSDGDAVTLKATECKIYLPNVFTPNNDGLNDRFGIVGARYVKSYRLEIYNRWGQMIYESTNAYEGWDGVFRGLMQDAGMYVYRIRYTNLTDEKFDFKGTFMLMR